MEQREIKFRAFDPKRRQMIYEANDLIGGYLIQIDLDGYISATYKQIVMNDEEEPILMQFTDLHDKNGKEIYEGDLLKREGGQPIKVEWLENEASFNIKSGVIKDMEIIGNIYERDDNAD